MKQFDINLFKVINEQYDQNINYSQCKTTENISLRRKIHQLLAQNYQVKQKMMKQQNQLTRLNEENINLKEQIGRMIEQLQVRNKAIKKYQQIAERAQFLSLQNSRLKQMVSDLQAESEVLTKIKDKYAIDLKKAKDETTKALNDMRGREDIDRQVSQNVYRANREIQQLFNEMKLLQIQKEEYLNQIYQFQATMVQADSRLQRSLDNQEILKNQIQKYKIKAQKYKRKAVDYKNERNEVFSQFQRGKLQIGSIKLKKYFPEEQIQF